MAPTSQNPSSFRSILDLPDDLFAPILEELPSIVDFQLACRSFHQRAASIPTLWTHLSSSQNPRISLERSQGCGLYIDLHIGRNILKDIKPFVTFLRLIEPHYARWRTFNLLDRHFSSPGHAKAIENLIERLHGKVFDQLKELGLLYIRESVSPFPLVLNQKSTPTEPKRSTNVWRTPALKRLEMNQSIPLRVMDCRLSEIRFHSRPPYRATNITTWASGDFSASLFGSSERLQNLQLLLAETSFVQTHKGFHVTLPKLRNLEIRITGFCNLWVLKSFSAPEVTRMVLGIYHQIAKVNRDTPITPTISALFPEGKCRFPRLQALELDLHLGRARLEHTNGLRHFLTNLPRISSLRLCTDVVEVPPILRLAESERLESPFPPLQSLHLSSCFRLDVSFIEALRVVFDSPTFEELIITDCRLEEDEVERVFPPEKQLVFD